MSVVASQGSICVEVSTCQRSILRSFKKKDTWSRDWNFSGCFGPCSGLPEAAYCRAGGSLRYVLGLSPEQPCHSCVPEAATCRQQPLWVEMEQVLRHFWVTRKAEGWLWDCSPRVGACSARPLSSASHALVWALSPGWRSENTVWGKTVRMQNPGCLCVGHLPSELFSPLWGRIIQSQR